MAFALFSENFALKAEAHFRKVRLCSHVVLLQREGRLLGFGQHLGTHGVKAELLQWQSFVMEALCPTLLFFPLEFLIQIRSFPFIVEIFLNWGNIGL